MSLSLLYYYVWLRDRGRDKWIFFSKSHWHAAELCVNKIKAKETFSQTGRRHHRHQWFLLVLLLLILFGDLFCCANCIAYTSSNIWRSWFITLLSTMNANFMISVTHFYESSDSKAHSKSHSDPSFTDTAHRSIFLSIFRFVCIWMKCCKHRNR